MQINLDDAIMRVELLADELHAVHACKRAGVKPQIFDVHLRAARHHYDILSSTLEALPKDGAL